VVRARNSSHKEQLEEIARAWEMLADARRNRLSAGSRAGLLNGVRGWRAEPSQPSRATSNELL
jgi:hypothetical protein